MTSAPINAAFTRTAALDDGDRRTHRRLFDGAGLARHLADLGKVLFFGGDLLARVFLEHDALAGHLIEELAVFREPFLFVRQRLAENLVDVVLVGLEQRADLQRRMAAEIGDVLARLRRVSLGLIGLAAQPRRRSECGCGRRS